MDREVSDFTAGMFVGIAFCLGIFAMSWHVGESGCQQEHNVADCVRSDTLFVPAIPAAEGK